MTRSRIQRLPLQLAVGATHPVDDENDLGRRVVNIGHDLNLDNLPPLVAAMPSLAEASIGHELTADALVMGFSEAVRAYKAALGDNASA